MAFRSSDGNPAASASSRLIELGPQISNVLARAIRTIATGTLLVCLALAQEPSQEPALPTLHVQTDLVVVPFQVRRGSRSVSNLKPSDVVLLEDGVPHDFTGFEAPPEHPSLELAVMFDVTDVRRGGFWKPKALHDMVGYWSEAIARALLEEPGTTVRISVYQFDKSRLRRLCRFTGEAMELLRGLNRLTDPIPDGQGFELRLPEGVELRPQNKERESAGWPLSLLGAMTVSADAFAGPKTAARALVIFSPGAEGTTIKPQNLADQGNAANVQIYPVVLPANQFIWYETGPNQLLQSGHCFASLPKPGFVDCPLNSEFQSVGNQTGGRGFEAPRGQETGIDQGLDRFSMTGGQVNEILQSVKRHALAGITSTYTMWFRPSPSASPRKHKLEVKLSAKSSGKLTDGKRSAIY